MRLPPQARVAVFYAPEADDPLAPLGTIWLGRDAGTNDAVTQPDLPGIAEITAEPRLYGLHATLKPPMRLHEGVNWEIVLEEAGRLARAVAPFQMPKLEIADLDGFLALREAAPCMQLQALADLCVAWLDRFRAPAGEEELLRRRAAGLSAAQEAMLLRYGYPYVFGTWHFHITLTRRLLPKEVRLVRDVALRHFAPALQVSRRARSLCLFTQAGPGLPFLLTARLPLRG